MTLGRLNRLKFAMNTEIVNCMANYMATKHVAYVGLYVCICIFKCPPLHLIENKPLTCCSQVSKTNKAFDSKNQTPDNFDCSQTYSTVWIFNICKQRALTYKY